MLSAVQPCFQLLRIGSSSATGDSVRDLYTFRPALGRSVFRLGRASELCDVTLDSPAVSRIHAELHAEREAGGEGGGGGGGEETPADAGWKVHVKDRSTHGTWVNEVRLQPGFQWELADSDTLSFGGQSSPGNPEFYFLFQKVKVRPLDFDAITIPKAGTFSSDLQNRIRTNLSQQQQREQQEQQQATVAAGDGMSRLSIKRATVILSSIGSLSKARGGSSWTFRRGLSGGGGGNLSDCASSSSSPPHSAGLYPPPYSSSSSAASVLLLPPCTPPPAKPLPLPPPPQSSSSSSRSRRKSAHTVLLEDDDSSDEARGTARGVCVGGVDISQRARGRKRRRLYKSESEGFTPPPPLQQPPLPPRRPFPVGVRTIGSYHGAVTNQQYHHGYTAVTSVPRHQGAASTEALHPQQRLKLAAFPLPAVAATPRGRRRANSAPVFCPLVVGGQNYSLASPSLRIRAEERGRGGAFNRLQLATGKRRGRPRKHPLPPRPSLPPPSSSSSSSSSSGTSSASSSSGSSSSSSSSSEGEEGGGGAGEPCAAAPRCLLPQQDTVQWVQCDLCDAWYHVDCLRGDRRRLLMDPSADFHCGCR